MSSNFVKSYDAKRESDSRFKELADKAACSAVMSSNDMSGLEIDSRMYKGQAIVDKDVSCFTSEAEVDEYLAAVESLRQE